MKSLAFHKQREAVVSRHMKILGREWAKGDVLLADGAWGTELFKRGLMQGSPPDEWNLTHPDIVRDITREYCEAGADIVLTNTFGANRFRLEPHGLSDTVKEINLTAAALAREIAGRTKLVAGDIGPTARFLALGEVSPEELFDVFSEQASALGGAGVDWIVVESMTDVEEMAIAVRAAAKATGLPVVASMTYNRTPKGFRTMMGNTPEICVQRAEEAGASLIGANCGSGIEDYVPLAPVLRALTSLPVWVKANAGIPQIVSGKVSYPLTAEQYASYVPSLVAAGVDVIGGCCGTDPGFIREMGKTIGSRYAAR
jgi:5-methyltetrahydrofolate--homocysteine methyltransferase